MNVYVITHQQADCSDIVGVYSTFDLALAACHKWFGYIHGRTSKKYKVSLGDPVRLEGISEKIWSLRVPHGKETLLWSRDQEMLIWETPMDTAPAMESWTQEIES